MTGIVIGLWTAAGFTLGVFHARNIWFAAQRASAWSALAGPLRIGVVAACLATAAYCGGILPAAAGWTLGFVATVLLALRFGRAVSTPRKG